jgi:DNA-3-methyladenine glycosylase II
MPTRLGRRLPTICTTQSSSSLSGYECLAMDENQFIVPVTAPFRLDFTAWALRRRGSNIVDQWTDGHYARLFVIRDRAVWVTIGQPKGAGRELVVTVRADQRIDERLHKQVRLLVHKMFGLTSDLGAFYLLAEHDEILEHLVAEFAGVRPPRFPTVFEALVNSVACQQVSLDSGIAALNRLSRAFGVSVVSDGAAQCAFPRPVDLLDVPVESIKELGFSRQKARTIKDLTEHVMADGNDLAHLENMTNDQVVTCLTGIRGIGRWSAEYVLLRGLGRLESFPGDDVGAQNNLQRLFDRDTKPGYDEIKTLVSRWSPYQGVVYFHLLLEKLRTRGLV